MGQSTGAGLRALLGSEADLDEACLTSNLGLLASDPVTPDQLRRVGERLLIDAIEPTEENARRASGVVAELPGRAGSRRRAMIAPLCYP